MPSMDKHYELLARLYLRLKGFVVTNLIIHSDVPGSLRSELDIVAIKMPFHAQNFRQVAAKDYLETSSDRIEIIIGDVKNYISLKAVQFNKGLRSDRESIAQLISRLGIYETVDQEKIELFDRYLNIHRDRSLNGFASYEEDLPLGKFTIKFMFFCPSLPAWNGNGFKYIHGDEMIEFAWECLNEASAVQTCSRRYDFGRWNELESYVRFFKGKAEKITIAEFETYCGQLDNIQIRY